MLVAAAAILGLRPGAVAAEPPAPTPCTGSVVGHLVQGWGDRGPVVGELVTVPGVARVPTGPDGTFRVDGVRPGRYEATARYVRFVAVVERCDQVVDVGAVEFPLIHPPIRSVAEVAATDPAVAALARFMDARIARRELDVLAMLTEEARAAAAGRRGSELALMQVSNPCWYRYAVEAFDRPAPGAAEARVRVYEHQWMGDVGGTLPRSWEQRIGLAQTAAGWRVARLGPPANRREEPKEVHGPTTSACNAMRGDAAGLWLVDGRRLLEGGRLPAGGGLPAWPTAALGAALVAVGRRLRSRGVARWGA
jgi:hypothetical protein